jgi:hypothetical protein
MSDHFDSDEFTAHPADENPMNVSESAVLRWMNRALNAEAALRKAQPTAEPVARAVVSNRDGSVIAYYAHWEKHKPEDHQWVKTGAARVANVYVDSMPTQPTAEIERLRAINLQYVTTSSTYRAELENERAEVEALRKLAVAARLLVGDAEEWDCDGLGLFAQHGSWEPLSEALEELDDAALSGKEAT